MRISGWSSDVCSSDLAPGAATAVIVTTLPDVDTNRHRVEVTPLFPTSGLDCVAWVSGSNNVAWFVRTPSGNPYGTLDLTSGLFMLIETEINTVCKLLRGLVLVHAFAVHHHLFCSIDVH